MHSLTLLSPAKINLSLRVLARRKDGYHELLTLFHRISLADTMKLTKAVSGFSLKCSDPRIPVNEDNLITRAYRLLQEKFPGLGGVRVYLRKRIPVGAGLGGGSSNAAFFLLGMKRLYRLKISGASLLRLGARLGADVPFFIHNTSQGLGIGRGDRVRKRVSRVRHFILLAASDQGLSTRDVYQGLKGQPLRPVSLTKISHELTMLCNFLARRKYEKARFFLQNDLEVSAFKLRPSLRKVIEQFKKRGIPFAGMTGSGPTVFGILPGLREAKRCLRELRKDLPENKILLCHSF